MQPTQSEIEFYQSRCPALKDDKWEWSDHQSFLSPRAMAITGRLAFKGVESERLASVAVYYHNNGTRCWFSVTVRGLDYPNFLYNKDVEINAYKADANILFAKANTQAKLLLGSRLDEIKAKEQEWLDELERMRARC